MKVISCLLVIAIVLATANAAAEQRRTGADRLPGGHLVVRLYDVQGVPATDLRLARRAAAEIFRAIGVDVTWVVCWSPTRPAASNGGACETTPALSAVMVRLMRAPVDSSDAVLGTAHVDRDTGTGTLASVFPDRIRATAARLHVDANTLFGRVLAHELGHLLGVRRHSRTGLMRAFWSEAMLRFGRDTDFLFGVGQVRQLRGDIALRNRIRAPSPRAALYAARD